MTDLNVSSISNLIRVNFTNRGLAKIVKDGSSLSSTTPNKSTIVNLSTLLSGLQIQRGAPIVFDTIQDFLGVDYIGYIIEKERLNKNTGEWERIDEYRIIGTSANSFTDTRIAYGESYRYRMRSVIKVSQSVQKPVLQVLSKNDNISVLKQNTINQSLQANQAILSNLNKTSMGLSSKTSSGIVSQKIKLDENTSLSVTPSSTEIVTSSSMANENLRLSQNLRVSNLSLTTGNSTSEELKTLINDNVNNLKQQSVSFESSYYESNPTKNWIYVNIIDETAPPAPQSIKIVPDSVNKQIMISWLKPPNTQRDIQYFKIYRREKVGDTWSLLTTTREIDLNSDGQISDLEKVEAAASLIPENGNLFFDKNVEFGKQYIYAMTCVDVHGTESFLSIQIQAQLNANFALEKQEKQLKWISGSGAKPSEINFVIKKFLNRNENLIAKKNIFISPTTKFAETRRDLIIKVKSLDTHIVHEVKVVLLNTNIAK